MLQDNVKNRTIFCHDNLEVLQGINSECIDLIYLDPPFNKKKEFTAPIGSSAEGASFKDWFRKKDVKDKWLQTIQEDYDGLYRFLNGVKTLSSIHHSSKANKHYLYNYCYLSYMAIRLIEMHRILKKTGSIYLHCDSTMSHYLKILMDIIFGDKKFRNEIIWQRNDKRGKGSQYKSKSYGTNTDTILFYTKTDSFTLKSTLKLSTEKILEKFNKVDAKGKPYYTGIPVFCSKSMGARPNLCFTWRDFTNPHPSGWRLSKERLEEEYQQGNVVIIKNKNNPPQLERRKYLKNYEGEPLDNNWTDIPRVSGKERTDYPTQKPLLLLERIIKASSFEGDVVLDPFCGCATACVAAEKYGRQWIGIDVSKLAYDFVKERYEKEIVQGGEAIRHIVDQGKEALRRYIKEIDLQVIPPKRSDRGENYQLQKYVYVISKPQYEGEYKVGIASNLKSRLNSYQTSSPDRNFKIEYEKITPYFREIEKRIHEKFPNKHEWVQGDLNAIIAEIENFVDLKNKAI